MDIAAIELNDALCMPYISEAIYFFLVLNFKFLWIRFQNESAARGSFLI